MENIKYNKDTKSFSINKTYSDIYDQFGESIKIGDRVIFYSNDSKDSISRLYKGVLKSWDKNKLEGLIQTLDFDQSEFGLPKLVKVSQNLIALDKN